MLGNQFVQVVEMVKSSLTALGLLEGAAHTELCLR